MNDTDRLFRCSGRHCAKLIYGDEAVRGAMIERGRSGRYCLECANTLGYYSSEQIDRFEQLLIDAGLMALPVAGLATWRISDLVKRPTVRRPVHRDGHPPLPL